MPSLVADRFEIRALAGQGGMGTVFRALDTKSGDTVALKMIDGHFAATRFEREAQLLARLSDDGIVGYVAHGTLADGRMYLAMEWLEGEPLDARLMRGPLSIDDSLAVTRRVASALVKGHALGIVHRDVKPANMILRDGRPDRAVLVDFGIARSAEATHALTKTGAVIGTPAYMAPEQARGEGGIDGRADTFSLGCVLFECLTGQPAFSGEHVIAVLAKVLLEPAPRVRSIRKDVPPALDALVASMLEKKRDGRPDDVIAALDGLGGLSLAPPSSPMLSLGPSERQFVTVLLMRPVEDTKADALAATFRSEETASLHGVALMGLANGALVGTEGGPEAALRVARCALAMKAADPTGVVAIATGRVVIAGKLPVGEAIDRAAALIAEHPRESAIWIDDATAAVLRGRFELGPNDGQLVGELAGDRVMGRVIPFVGRDREMALLEATYRECEQDSVASATLVVAPPGIGKSRLRRELVTRLAACDPAPVVWIGLANALAAGSPFALLGDVVMREKLDDRFLAEIAGARLGDDAADPELKAARADPTLLADRVTDAFVSAALAKTPLVLVLEDVHWADRASLRAVEELLTRAKDFPLMVVAFARPAVDEAHPKLWAELGCRRVDLEPLPRKPAERLARALLGPGADVEAIVQRAEGNALFVEELARACASGGQVSDLPPTLVAVAEARLLALDAEARQLLRAGAVFGERFWRSAVAKLVAADVDDRLDDLVRRELLVRASSTRFVDEKEMVFRHAIVRDAAYAMLTDEDRRLGHALAAEWLAPRALDPALLAHHQELGGMLEEAASSHALAAENAVHANDRAAMLHHVARAEACGATGHVRGRAILALADFAVWRNDNEEGAARGREAMALLDRGSAPWFVAAGGVAVALGKLARIDGLLAVVGEIEATPAADPPAARRRAMASARTATQIAFVGELDRAQALIDGCTFEPGDAAVEGRLADAEFDRRFLTGRILHPDVPREAAKRYAAIGDRRGELAQISNVAMAFALIGAHEEGLRTVDEAKATPREAGSLWYVRSLNEAVREMQRGDVGPMIAFTDTLPVPRVQWGHWLWIAVVLFDTDRMAARSYLDRAVAGVAPYPAMRSVALALSARFAAAEGDGPRAVALIEEARALTKRGLIVVELNLLPLVAAEAYEVGGRAEDARGALAAGLVEMEACAAGVGVYGAIYLERGPGVPELRAMARARGLLR